MMTITWDIDEARAVIRAQMAEANRLDEVIDDLLAETSAAIARAEAADATLASCNRARQAAEAECERLREQVATLRHAFQFVMNATGNRFSITSINVATAALDATAN